MLNNCTIGNVCNELEELRMEEVFTWKQFGVRQKLYYVMAKKFKKTWINKQKAGASRNFKKIPV